MAKMMIQLRRGALLFESVFISSIFGTLVIAYHPSLASARMPRSLLQGASLIAGYRLLVTAQ